MPGMIFWRLWCSNSGAAMGGSPFASSRSCTFSRSLVSQLRHRAPLSLDGKTPNEVYCGRPVVFQEQARAVFRCFGLWCIRSTRWPCLWGQCQHCTVISLWACEARYVFLLLPFCWRPYAIAPYSADRAVRQVRCRRPTGMRGKRSSTNATGRPPTRT